MTLSSAPTITEAHTTRPPLRILFVTPRYFPDMGGIETHVYEVARRLVPHVQSITVLTTDLSGRREPESVVGGCSHSSRSVPIRTTAIIISRPPFAQHIRRADYDIIHVQGYHTFVPPLAMWAAQRELIPYVLTFHSGGSSSRLRNVIRPCKSRCSSDF